jgi:SAM-dependent methyltransferase
MPGTAPARPSATHPNRGAHNRLAYDLGDRAVSQMERHYGGVLVDLGCGTAPYRDYLSRFVDRYVGVDWSSSFHAIAADVVADLNRPLPFADGAADTVFCLSVLEHLREPAALLREARRILRPGGRIVLMVPFMWPVHEAPHDYFRFTRHGLQHLFEAAGYAEIDVREVSGFWTTWVLKLNYQTRKLIRGPLPVRLLVRGALGALWWADQAFARIMDRHWNAPEESQAYIVAALRP